MLRVDLLIGPYELPPKVESLLLLPEVQRLKDIRLLNIFSPTFQALGEARRLSHSMALVGLSQRLVPRLRNVFTRDDIEHWQVSLLVHDIGTPPFGHLLEYRLLDRWGWRHESVLLDIVYGRYRPENIDDQIYFGNQLRLFKMLRKLAIEPERLSAHVTGVSALGKLVAGSVDLDNIDTVFRMAALLGIGLYRDHLFSLVDALGVHRDMITVDEEGVPALKLWIRLRRRVYVTLLFDVPSLSLQAMLTDAFDKAIDKGLLSPAQWRLTDDEVLRLLFEGDETRQVTKRIATADYYQPVGILWFGDPQGYADRLLGSEQRLALQERVSLAADIPVISYPFIDRGAFSKHLSIPIVRNGRLAEPSVVSEESRSVVIGFFSPVRRPIAALRRQKSLRAAVDALQALGLAEQRPVPVPVREEGETYEQGTLPG